MSKDAPGPGRGKARTFLTCSVVAIAFLLLGIFLAWLGMRPLWKHDPFKVGMFEELIEAQGFVFEDTNKDDDLDGYVLRTRDKGRWAERIYIHPQSGAEIYLKRSLPHGQLGNACTVSSRNEGGREALVRFAGEFSPYLTRRIAEAEAESGRTGIWVRVTAPDFDIGVKPDWLSIDSRPGEYTGADATARAIERLFWRISRLAGHE